MTEGSPERALRYADVVDYDAIDPFKVMAQRAALATVPNLAGHGYHELSGSRGESAFVWDAGDRLFAAVLEGLGTKNLAADIYGADTPGSCYEAIAKDNVAMIVNDLITTGARPLLFWMHLAAGNSDWFKDIPRLDALLRGTVDSCNEAGMTYAGGETPTLAGIVNPDTVELSGFAIGEINPKEDYVPGDQIEDGDAIILVESNGIHANGLSTARALADRLPDGYDTKLSDGSAYGEALLRPTHLYSGVVQELLADGIKVSRFENITGHGWRKLMRAREPFTYRMHTRPPVLPLFEFMQAELGVDNEEMYGNYNMNAGFAIYVRGEDAESAQECISEAGFDSVHAGDVEKGPKQVIIEDLDVVFAEETLGVRG